MGYFGSELFFMARLSSPPSLWKERSHEAEAPASALDPEMFLKVARRHFQLTSLGIVEPGAGKAHG